jgi:hypothetical protein
MSIISSQSLFCYTCISLEISKIKFLAMVFTALKAL